MKYTKRKILTKEEEKKRKEEKSLSRTESVRNLKEIISETSEKRGRERPKDRAEQIER